MRSLLQTLLAILALAGGWTSTAASAADWITAPSYYTHDWSSGQRVAQYTPIGPFYYYQRDDYVKSGYTHHRSTLDLGNSSDNIHIVEEWGNPVRPYEEWRFPFRPYSVPYDAWGPPFGGLGGGVGVFPFGGGFPGMYPYSGGGVGPGGFPGSGSFNQPPTNFAQPWLDGHYPRYDTRDRSDYWKPYTAPVRPHVPGPMPPGPMPPGP
jgi:hypothetical protein